MKRIPLKLGIFAVLLLGSVSFVFAQSGNINKIPSSGSGGSSTSTPSFDYVVYTKSGLVTAIKTSTGATLSSNVSANVVLNAIVADSSSTGASISVAAGTYYLNSTTTFPGTTDSAGITWKLWGAGQSATNFVVANTSDGFYLKGSVKTDLRNFTIYLKGSANGLVSDSNGSGFRSVWNSTFDGLMIRSTTTDSTGWGIHFTNDFRNTYNNIQFLGLGGCIKSGTEVTNTFNNGDSVYQNMMCDLSANTTGAVRYAYYFDGSSGVSVANQDSFTDVNAFSNQGSTTAWYFNHTKWMTAKGINSEGFSTTTEFYNDSDNNNFEFEYNIGSTTPSVYYFMDSTSEANTIGVRYTSSYAGTHTILSDANTSFTLPNILQGVGGSDGGLYGSGTFTYATTSSSIVRDINNRGNNTLQQSRLVGNALDINYANGGDQKIVGRASSYDFENNGIKALTITNGGKVGVGTTSPFYKFNVYSGTTQGQVGISGAGSAFNYSQLILGDADLSQQWNLEQRSAAGEVDNFVIESNRAGSFKQRLVIASSTGNVSIGASTSPSAKLSIAGAGTGTGRAFAVADSASNEHLTVLDNGNIGIGTTVPTHAFQVGPYFSADVAGDYNLGYTPFTIYQDAFGSLIHLTANPGYYFPRMLNVLYAPPDNTANNLGDAEAGYSAELPVNGGCWNGNSYNCAQGFEFGAQEYSKNGLNYYSNINYINAYSRTTGTTTPIAISFEKKGVGGFEDRYIAMYIDPSGSTAIGGYASTTSNSANKYDKTIPLQVSSSTASTVFAVDTSPQTHIFQVLGTGVASTTNLTISGITGTQCLHTTGSGVVAGTGSDCGSGSSLSGGSPNDLTFWTSASAVSATGSPTVGYIFATSTNATSTFLGGVSVGTSTVIGNALVVQGQNATDNNVLVTNGTSNLLLGFQGSGSQSGIIGMLSNNSLTFKTNSSSRAIITGGGLYGFGTTTSTALPANFTVWGNGTGTKNAFSVVNSASSTSFTVLDNGFAGVGTTSPYRTLSVNGSSDLGTNALAGYFTATTSTASSLPYASSTALTLTGNLFAGANNAGTAGNVLQSTGSGIQWVASTTFSAPLVYAVNGVTCTSASSGVTGCLTGTDWNTFNGKQAALSGQSPNTLAFWSSSSALGGTSTPTFNSLWATSTLLTLPSYFAGYVGIGTTTPSSPLFVASSTASQICSSDASINIWCGRVSPDGNYYFGTTSPTTNATNTPSAIEVLKTGNPSFSVGTTTTTGILNLGNNPATTNGSSTIFMNKLQWDGNDSGGVRRCVFINASGALTTILGACTN